MRKVPIGVSILKRLAPETVNEGIVFAVPPKRIELAPWLESLPNGARQIDELVHLIWSFGLRAPLLARAAGRDRYQLVAEREFLEAAAKANVPSVRLHVVKVDDALGRAVAIAALARAEDRESVTALRAALDEAGVSMPTDLLAGLALHDE